MINLRITNFNPNQIMWYHNNYKKYSKLSTKNEKYAVLTNNSLML